MNDTFAAMWAKGILGKLLSGKVLLYGIAVVLAIAGVQTVRLAWAEGRIAKLEQAHAEAVKAAVETALKAEREAQARHDKREEARRVSSDALRRKAEAAPEGSKTKAVLDGLRGS